MKVKFTRVETELIGHRLEVMDDILFDVWQKEIEEKPAVAELLEEGLDFVMKRYKPGMPMEIDLTNSEGFVQGAVVAILVECLRGGTLLDIAEENCGTEWGPTHQKVTALHRAHDSARTKITNLALGGSYE